jgi:tRNA pseudouridine55 synthase
VDRVVRVLGARKVGHAGTLDPFARGLLLVAWGKATSLVPFLQEYPKTYRVQVRFGRETDTQDRTGRTVAESDIGDLTAARIREALPRFRGLIRQTPPMFSALKRDGRRLYTWARRGERIALGSRERRVERFELVEWDPPFGRFEVVCAKGTYVRTLAHDMGRALGTGACVDELIRTRIGPFHLDQAVSGDGIAETGKEQLLSRAVPPAHALPDWPAVTVSAADALSVARGAWRDPEGAAAGDGKYRILDASGDLLALVQGGTPVTFLRVLAESPE